MWRTFGQSHRGGTHVRMDLPCQDASLCREGKGYFIAAVADGHGSRRHFRSERGSSMACSIACACMEELHSLRQPPSEEEIRQLKEHILAAWKRAVREDAAQHPWTDEELQEQQKLLDPDEYGRLTDGWNVWIPYGTTLVAVMAAKNYWLSLQLGDGEVTFISPEGDFDWPMPESRIDRGQYTASLCMENPMPEFRHCTGQDFPAAFLVYTDGIEKSFPARGAQLTAFLYALWRVAYAGRADEVERALDAVARLGPVRDDAAIAGIFDPDVRIEKPDLEQKKRSEQLAHLQAEIDEIISTVEYNQNCLQKMRCQTSEEQYAAMEMEQILLECGRQLDELKDRANALMQDGTAEEKEQPAPQPTDRDGAADVFQHEDPQLTWSLPPQQKDGETCDPDCI